MAIKSYAELVKAIEEKVQDTLEDNVFEEVRDVMQKNIDEMVYDVYNPKKYLRRDIDDGLIADKNITGEVSGTTLSVENITKANPDIYESGSQSVSKNAGQLLTPIIEEGGPYDFDYDYGYNKPRRFIQGTKNELKQTKAHVNALKEGLKNRGLNVK